MLSVSLTLKMASNVLLQNVICLHAMFQDRIHHYTASDVVKCFFFPIDFVPKATHFLSPGIKLRDVIKYKIEEVGCPYVQKSALFARL